MTPEHFVKIVDTITDFRTTMADPFRTNEYAVIRGDERDIDAMMRTQAQP
jgi:hypothetical protein